jgi:hypothetical protein
LTDIDAAGYNSHLVTTLRGRRMADREHSAAYAAMTPCGKTCLHLIEGEIERHGGTASISRVAIERTGVSRASVNFGLKQIVQCGFMTISVGRRHINTFRLADDWKSLDADEAKRRVALAKLPKPPVARALPPKPVKPPKPPKVTALLRTPDAVAAVDAVAGRRAVILPAGPVRSLPYRAAWPFHPASHAAAHVHTVDRGPSHREHVWRQIERGRPLKQANETPLSWTTLHASSKAVVKMRTSSGSKTLSTPARVYFSSWWNMSCGPSL